ncbi:MAG: NUDIX hydrolase [Solirubrobacteraceae bacterium]
MDIDAPPPGETLNETGEVVTPRQAAGVILLRGGSDALEVLLVKRTPKARFMGGVWVFPGGAVDSTEAEDDAPHRAAAVRELREEAGIAVADPSQLVLFSRWITPEQVSIRFDTHFFLAPAPGDQMPAIDGTEVVDHGWFSPQDALEAHEREEILLVFPTIKDLEKMTPHDSAEALLHAARTGDVTPTLPKVVTGDGRARVLLPGEPGYDG